MHYHTGVDEPQKEGFLTWSSLFTQAFLNGMSWTSKALKRTSLISHDSDFEHSKDDKLITGIYQ